MRISRQSRRDAKKLFRACTRDGAPDPAQVREAAKALVTKKPRGYVAVLEHFRRLIKFELDRRTARIESSTALAPEMRAQIEQALTARFGSGLEFHFAENPALIGGLRVQVGSDVFDGSVKARLEGIETALG